MLIFKYNKNLRDMMSKKQIVELVNEAKKDVTAEELKKFLEDTYKSEGDAKKYDVELDPNADKDEFPAHVTFSYDVVSKKGYVRASNDIFFDLNDQTWFDQYNDGGPMKGLNGVKSMINKHIRDEKKAITG